MTGRLGPFILMFCTGRQDLDERTASKSRGSFMRMQEPPLPSALRGFCGWSREGLSKDLQT